MMKKKYNSFYFTQSEQELKEKQVRIDIGKKEQEGERFGVYGFISAWFCQAGTTVFVLFFFLHVYANFLVREYKLYEVFFCTKDMC